MLGRNTVGKRGRNVKIRHKNDRAVIAPALTRNFAPLQREQMPLDCRLHSLRHSTVSGDKDRLSTLVVLGL